VREVPQDAKESEVRINWSRSQKKRSVSQGRFTARKQTIQLCTDGSGALSPMFYTSLPKLPLLVPNDHRASNDVFNRRDIVNISKFECACLNRIFDPLDKAKVWCGKGLWKQLPFAPSGVDVTGYVHRISLTFKDGAAIVYQ